MYVQGQISKTDKVKIEYEFILHYGFCGHRRILRRRLFRHFKREANVQQNAVCRRLLKSIENIAKCFHPKQQQKNQIKFRTEHTGSPSFAACISAKGIKLLCDRMRRLSHALRCM